MSRTEPNLDWSKRGSRDAALAALRTMRIGPAFPSSAEEGPGIRESRRDVRLGKDTKPPFLHGRRRRRRVADAVTATCLSCRWTTSGRTWRPTKRRLAEHVGKKHPRLAAAS